MNYTSVIIASLVPLLTGFIWYNLIFKKSWLLYSGVSDDAKKRKYHPALLYSVTFTLSLFVAIGLFKQIVFFHSYIDKLTDGDGIISEHPFFHGMLHGFQDLFLYGAIPVLIINSLFDQKGWKYLLINMGYWMLTIPLMGGIIGWFGW